MISAVLATLLAALAAVCSSGFVANLVKPRLQTWLEHQGFGEIHIGGLALGLLPPTITATDVTLTPPGGHKPTMTLRHAQLKPDFWPAPSGAPVIAALTVAGLQGELSVDPNAVWQALRAPDPRAATPHRSSDALHLPVDIRTLVLHNSDVTWRWGKRFVHLGGINAELYASARHGRVLSATVGHGTLYWPGRLADDPISFDGHTEAEIVGSIDRPQAVHLNQTHFNMPGMRLGLSGQIELALKEAGRARQMKINATAVADLSRLSHLVTQSLPLRGRAHLEMLWQGALSNPRVDVELSCEDLGIGLRHIGDVQLEAAGNRRGLTVEAVRLTHPDGSNITGSGRLGLDAPYNLELTAHLQNAALPVILEAAGVTGPWVRMHLLGEVQGVGTLQPFHLSLVTDVNARGFQILDRSFHDPEARAVLHIPNGSLRGTAEVDATATHIEAVEVASGASQLSVGGTLPYSTKRGLDLKVVAKGFELADLGPIAGIPYIGLGGFVATIAGPYNHLDIDCALTAAGFTIDAYSLGDTEAKLRYHAPQLDVLSIAAVRGQGRFNGSGRLLFGPPGVQAEGTFDAERLDMAELLVDLGLNPTFARHFGAAVSGRLVLKGPLKHLAGSAELSAPHLRVDHVPLGSMQLQGSFGQPPSRLWGTLTLRPTLPNTGMLVCHSELFDDGTLALSADVQHIPVALFTPFAGDAPINGMLTARGALGGQPKHLAGHLSLDIQDVRAYGLNFGDVHLAGQADDGALRLEGHLLDAEILLDATLQLARTLQFFARARFADLQMSALRLPRPAGLDASLAGALTAQGALNRPQDITGDATLNRIAITWHQLKLVSRKPVNLHYGNDRLTFAAAFLEAPGLRLQMAGELVAGRNLDAQLSVAGDLSAVRSFSPDLAAARGPWSLRMTLSGPIVAPVLNGEGSLENGSLRLANSEQVLEKLAVHALFTGRSIALHDGRAQLGGGTLRFSGEAQLGTPVDHTPQMNMHMTLQQVGLRLYPELDTTLSGTLDLSGKLAALSLQGALKMDQLRYTARIDIDRLLPKRGVPPIKAPLMPVGQAIRLAIKLHGANNLIISSSMLEAELQADLNLTGTTERLGLMGNITPLWARARYRDNVFQLTRASIDFVDEYRIFPEFLLQAHTQACNLQADVTIQGNPEHYTVTPYGQDEHGAVDPQDVLACLQFGLRLRDFDGNQKNAAGIGDALPGGLDALWAVSGLDDKVRKLLPINVDEIRLTSGWSSLSQRTTARVLVGKELGGQIALRYSRSLDEYSDQAFSLEYRLNPRLTLQGTWLSALDVPVGDFGVDLRLHWELH